MKKFIEGLYVKWQVHVACDYCVLYVVCSLLSHVSVPLQKAVRVLHACVAQPDLTFFAPPAAVTPFIVFGAERASPTLTVTIALHLDGEMTKGKGMEVRATSTCSTATAVVSNQRLSQSNAKVLHVFGCW